MKGNIVIWVVALFVIGLTTVQAQGGETIVQGNNLMEKLDRLKVFVQSNGHYILEVNADESITNDQNFTYCGKSNITITIKGIGKNRTISRSSRNDLFIVGSGVTLILENNITLRDRKNGDVGSRLVSVDNNGKFIMNDGSTITGNTCSYEGGGVCVNGGTFIMNGGSITGNEGSSRCGSFDGYGSL